MKTIEEVRKIYKDYQDKKVEIDRAKAVLLEKQTEYKKLEDGLIEKYGPEYARVLEESVEKLEEWIGQKSRVVPLGNPAVPFMGKPESRSSVNPFGA